MSENNILINGVDDLGSMLLAQTSESEPLPQSTAQSGTQDADAISAETIKRAIDTGRAEYAASITAGVQKEQALKAAVAMIEQVALQQGMPSEQAARLAQVARSWFAELDTETANIDIAFTTLSTAVGIMEATAGGFADIALDQEIINAAIKAGREHFADSVSAGADPTDIVDSTVQVIAQAVLDSGASPQQAAQIAQIAQTWFSGAADSGIAVEVALDALASAVVILSDTRLFAPVESTRLKSAIEATDSATEKAITEETAAEETAAAEETPDSADYDLPWDQGDFATADDSLDTGEVSIQSLSLASTPSALMASLPSLVVGAPLPPPSVAESAQDEEEDDNDDEVVLAPAPPNSDRSGCCRPGQDCRLCGEQQQPPTHSGGLHHRWSHRGNRRQSHCRERSGRRRGAR